MNRIDDPRAYAQLLRLLDDGSLRAHASRVKRHGVGDDLVVIRSEFQRRRAERRADGFNLGAAA